MIRRLAGVETVTLRASPMRSLTVPKEWTDLALPCAATAGETRSYLEFASLLLLADLVDQLKCIPRKELDK
jgi:Family of unknown function (DUF5372)